MPDLASVHPQIVHFVVALIVVGVAFRLVSLLANVRWLVLAASTLIALGAAASVLAVRSGLDAHGAVERVPGARAAVAEHEVWGERARNTFLILLVIEAAATAVAVRRPLAARRAGVVAAVAGFIAVALLYKAGAAGGDLVYSYAGGVGIRSGAPEDVNRLLIAAAHHQAEADRKAGKLMEAAALTDLVADRFPDQLELQLARVESTINDLKLPQVALERLATIHLPTDDTRLRVRAGLLRSDALAAAGDVMAARQVLEMLKAEFPSNQQIKRRLAELPSSTQ